MNPKLDSYLRHIFTGWIAIAVAWLAAMFVMTPQETEAVKDGLGQIGNGVLLVLGTLAPVIGRWAWGKMAGFFRSSGQAPEEETQRGPGPGEGLGAWVMIGTAAALLGALPSCSPVSGLPIVGSVSYRDPRSGAKAGLVFDPAGPPRARVAVPILDPDTGEQVGFAELSTTGNQVAK